MVRWHEGLLGCQEIWLITLIFGLNGQCVKRFSTLFPKTLPGTLKNRLKKFRELFRKLSPVKLFTSEKNIW